MASAGVRQIVANVAKTLTDDWRVAVYPDHPHAYQVPQVLAGARGNLVAVFVPTKSEDRNPNRLASRLSIARLSLPPNAVCALVFPAEARIHAEFENFDVVLSSSEVTSLPRIAGSGHQRIVRQRLAGVQFEAKRRYSAFLQMARRHFETVATTSTRLAEIRRRVVSDIRARTEAIERRAPGGFVEYELDKSVVVTSGREEGRSILRGLSALTLDVVQNSYALDAGIPYLVNPTPFALVVDQWPVAKYDPHKPARAAAFVGIALIAPRSTDDLFRFVSRLEQFSAKIHL